ncbi:hypothetical protein C5167_050567 [Papaver somniferum]|uniref:Uncharacterized protein n=1 Tax=Papaver somniferum TaxID=3469 RepID=A0A4Y7KRV6_PAPSO|nr:hypothetical protein C5167_050567 [Papaver somniferum]
MARRKRHHSRDERLVLVLVVVVHILGALVFDCHGRVYMEEEWNLRCNTWVMKMIAGDGGCVDSAS